MCYILIIRFDSTLNEIRTDSFHRIKLEIGKTHLFLRKICEEMDKTMMMERMVYIINKKVMTWEY